MSAPEEDFVHTGPETPAGRYLRMFWQPVFRAEDLAPGDALPIRIMSEDFTLYRGESGGVHLVAFRCAHRGTQLSTGWIEGETIRCRYHGWRYDGTGQCVEQPGEEEAFAKKIKIRSYPAKEYLGLIFAFLGEGAPPPVRRYPEMEGEGVLEVYAPEVWPCNYFNRIDNACDAAHVVFTHRDSRLAVNELPPLPEVTAEETEYGVETKVNTPGQPNGSLHFLMPNTNHFKASIRLRDPEAPKGTVSRLLWRVPVDDVTCISFGLDFATLTAEAAKKYRERRREMRAATAVPAKELGPEVLQGKLRVNDLRDQRNLKNLTSLEDYVVQVGQGAVADRLQDRLGRIDAGVILLRKIWARELRALVEGRPLKQWEVPAVFPTTGEV
jgi:5,5'-dehydrodivanillate O-demethylase oxygenase subunit